VIKRLVLILACLFAVLSGFSVEHEYVLSLQYGGVALEDEYLSPMRYKGWSVGFRNEWWQKFRRHPEWQHTGKVYLGFSRTHNQTYYNSIDALQVRGGWGAHRRFDNLWKGLSISVGPALYADMLVKYIGSYVNKPVSMDLAASVGLHTVLQYSFKLKKVDISLRYELCYGFLGFGFAQDYWESYYELLKGVGHDVRFLAPWHYAGLQHQFSIDIRCRKTAWRVGVEHSFVHTRRRQMTYETEQVRLTVATIIRYKLLSPRE